MRPPCRPDPWSGLRTFTEARIALGRAGDSLQTREVLALGLAHARARDPVQVALDPVSLAQELAAHGFASIAVHSAAADRAQFLRRPDLGRQLDQGSRERLDDSRPDEAPDLVLVLADGLSAAAVRAHALPLLLALRPWLAGRRLAPLVIAEQARVGLGDEIAARLGARQVAMLNGERPGLSSADSLGVYFTHAPRVGLSDAERNCISNIRPGGLAPETAARKLAGLLRAALALGYSGVRLKEADAESVLPDLPDA